MPQLLGVTEREGQMIALIQQDDAAIQPMGFGEIRQALAKGENVDFYTDVLVRMSQTPAPPKFFGPG